MVLLGRLVIVFVMDDTILKLGFLFLLFLTPLFDDLWIIFDHISFFLLLL